MMLCYPRSLTSIERLDDAFSTSPFAGPRASRSRADRRHAPILAEDSSDESKAIAKIELVGGKITRNDELDDRPVIGIDLQGCTKANDKTLHLVDLFTSLESLNLRSTKITDSGLKAIGGSHEPETTLSLDGTRVTNPWFEGIAAIEKVSHRLNPQSNQKSRTRV